MAEVRVETSEPTRCAGEIPDQLRGKVFATVCNAPAVQLCERHLEAERSHRDRALRDLKLDNEQLRLMLGALIGRVETEAAAKMRLYAVVDAAKGMLG